MEVQGKVRFVTKIIYWLVYKLELENLIVKFSRFNLFFIKLIPQSTFYKNSDVREVFRDGVRFKLELKDYMQWHIFANCLDNSWKMATKYIDENTIFLDVGASSGAFCLKLGKVIENRKIKNSRIFAFEPNPFVYNKLKSNLELNPGLEKIVKLFPFGIGDSNVFLPFQFDVNNSGGGKFLNTTSSSESTRIEVKKLDDLLEELVLDKITFMKIDVEGFEPFVIKGGKRVIESFKPIIFIEITDEWFQINGSSALEVLRYFEQLNYKLYAEENNAFVDLGDSRVKERILNLDQFNLLVIK